MGRLVIGGRARQPQADTLGMSGQQAENRQRVQPRGILRAQFERARTGCPGLIAHRQAIGEKQQVEAAIFQRPGDFDVVVGVEKVACGLRVSPYRVAVYHRA
ncbi:hypothetical protein D3C76_1421910 [compost metagenome]